MEIKVRSNGKYKNVEIIHYDEKIDLGFLDEDECEELAKVLIGAVWDISPETTADDADAWVVKMLNECQIPVKKDED